jgi:hypothetical protein
MSVIHHCAVAAGVGAEFDFDGALLNAALARNLAEGPPADRMIKSH